jgi:hypothetical protein
MQPDVVVQARLVFWQDQEMHTVSTFFFMLLDVGVSRLYVCNVYAQSLENLLACVRVSLLYRRTTTRM